MRAREGRQVGMRGVRQSAPQLISQSRLASAELHVPVAMYRLLHTSKATASRHGAGGGGEGGSGGDDGGVSQPQPCDDERKRQ